MTFAGESIFLSFKTYTGDFLSKDRADSSPALEKHLEMKKSTQNIFPVSQVS